MPEVTVTIPANPAYVGLLRSACAHVAAEADLTLEEIQDLRIAVSEAATLLMPHAEQLTFSLTPSEHQVKVLCSAVTDATVEINRDDLGWILLSSLANVDPIHNNSTITIEITKVRAEL